MVFLHSIKRMGKPKQGAIKPDPGRFKRGRAALGGAWLGIKGKTPSFDLKRRPFKVKRPSLSVKRPSLSVKRPSLSVARPSLRGKLPSGPALDPAAIWHPVEDGAWFLRKRVLWRIADRFAGLDTRGRLATAGGTMLAVGVGVAVLALAVSGGSGSPASTESASVTVASSESAATAEPPAIKVVAPPASKPKSPPAPTLHGAAPVFVSPKSRAKASDAKAAGGKPGGVTAAAQPKEAPKATEKAIKPANVPAATARIGATPAASATASSANATAAGAAADTEGVAGNSNAGGATRLDGPPAGPKAIKVARDFAGAFVVYETGGIDSHVRETFGHSATPALSHALLKRPPRQPANVKVPRAKVVNIVPGPSQGKVFTVSVSLLRVGVTSELRLEMEQRKHDGWQVTNVLG